MSGPGYSNSGKQSWNVWDWEFGFKAKYPFEFARGFFLTPTIGLDWLNYGGSTANSPQLSSDEKQLYGPAMVTVGYEFTAYLTDRLFLRFPFDLGWGLNTKLSDGYYSNLSGGSASYNSSSLTFLSSGVSMGYSF